MAEEEKKALSKEEIKSLADAEKKERVNRFSEKVKALCQEEQCGIFGVAELVQIDDKGRYGIQCKVIFSVQ